jgi:N-acetylmuramoyl-L-alanine amidase CwlA
VQKKLEKKKVDDAREVVSKALQNEEKVRKNSGREQGSVIRKVEQVLKTHHIAKPYYHGGKYHGKAMVHLMDKS